MKKEVLKFVAVVGMFAVALGTFSCEKTIKGAAEDVEQATDKVVETVEDTAAEVDTLVNKADSTATAVADSTAQKVEEITE